MPPQTIYHYTSASAVASIVGKDLNTKLYATHSDYLNDHNELNTGISLIKYLIKDDPKILGISDYFLKTLDMFINFPDEYNYNPGYFITCFSEVTGIVDQWRGYGNSGYGFALGYEFDSLLELSNKQSNVALLECVYDYDSQVKLIVDAARKAESEYGQYSQSNEYDSGNASKMDDFSFADTIIRTSLQIKHEAFKQEKEWRLVVNRNFANEDQEFNSHEYQNLKFRTSQIGLIPYVVLDLPKITRIVVGPSPDQNGNAAAVKLLLRNHAFNEAKNIIVELENIPYRG